MSHVIGLKCRECGAQYPAAIQNTCFECFGPLEVNYDWEYIKENISKEKIGKGPSSIWRYADLLPVEGTDYIDLGAGLKILVEEGRIDPDERTVVYVTGNGLKAQDTLIKHTRIPQAIKPAFGEFEKQYAQLVVT